MSHRAAVHFRGRHTGKLQLSVNRAGKTKVTPRAPPSWHRLKAVNWVVGRTLERIKLLKLTPVVARDKVPPVGTEARALAKMPTPAQRRMGCDRCSGLHRKRNAACSAALGIPTPLNDPGAIYDFATGNKLDTKWVVVSESCMPRAKVTSRIYRRIS